jgi:hypothetical protein
MGLNNTRCGFRRSAGGRSAESPSDKRLKALLRKGARQNCLSHCDCASLSDGCQPARLKFCESHGIVYLPSRRGEVTSRPSRPPRGGLAVV